MNYHTDEDNNLDGYCGDLSPMMATLARKSLNRVYRLKDNRVIFAKHHIREMVAKGDIKFKVLESPRIKPMSRIKYFRSTNEEQAAHEKRMKEGGNKKTYLVNNYDYGKTGFDYAKYLQSKVG